MTIAPEAPTKLRFLSLEITGRCQLSCPSLCYAKSGPKRDHGSMTDDDWNRIIDEAVALGVESIQIIGGEPTMHPAFARMLQRGIDAGLRIRVYTNLLRVREEHWRLFEHPNVSLAATYHSTVATEHDEVTGRTGSHTATRANVVEAVRRGIRLTVAVLDGGDPERAEQARAELQALGVHKVRVSQVRAVGNAAGTVLPSVSSLCGQCANQKAAVLPNGQVAPCEIGRFLTAGSVKDVSLASVLGSDRWAEVAASIPHRLDATLCPPDCAPNDDSACGPDNSGPCGPADDE
ncbi:radical SAM protein [Streptomyces montanus]|uniref:Radical SAM protein n=1 Tax=Streptomyces montanus TaxID=2580423 RepID=A0A5R9FXR2_9ACTN|nr:radical SAM protein [Streptomyces montanus]TLS46078.1 radical SAM protein [Streptomyces montanus]